LWFLNVFGNILLAILHLEIAKNLFAAGSAERLNSPLLSYGLFFLQRSWFEVFEETSAKELTETNGHSLVLLKTVAE